MIMWGEIKGRQVICLMAASCVLRLGGALPGGKSFQASQSKYLASADCSAKHMAWESSDTDPKSTCQTGFTSPRLERKPLWLAEKGLSKVLRARNVPLSFHVGLSLHPDQPRLGIGPILIQPGQTTHTQQRWQWLSSL